MLENPPVIMIVVSQTVTLLLWVQIYEQMRACDLFPLTNSNLPADLTSPCAGLHPSTAASHGEGCSSLFFF